VADALTPIQQAYGAFGRGDIAGVLENLADDVEWTLPNSETPIAGTVKGKAEVQAWFGRLAEMMEFQRFDTTDFVASGDKVVVLVEADATMRRSGKRFTEHLAHVFTVRGDKVASFREYSDSAPLTAAYKG
jgi:ketosteroid isomerase-like protein